MQKSAVKYAQRYDGAIHK